MQLRALQRHPRVIPTIGLVVFGYVLVRMLELALNPQTPTLLKVCASGLMAGTDLAAVVLIPNL